MLGKTSERSDKMKLGHLDYVKQELLKKNVCKLTEELNQTKKRGRRKVLNSNKSFKRWVRKSLWVFRRRGLKSRLADGRPQNHVWFATPGHPKRVEKTRSVVGEVIRIPKENWNELQETCERGEAVGESCLHSQTELKWSSGDLYGEELGKSWSLRTIPALRLPSFNDLWQNDFEDWWMRARAIIGRVLGDMISLHAIGPSGS